MYMQSLSAVRITQAHYAGTSEQWSSTREQVLIMVITVYTCTL